MKALLDDAADRALRYLEALHTRPVAPSPEAIAALRSLEGPLPESGESPHAVVAQLDEVVSPATIASAGPRYFGFVTGGTLPAALGASWLAGAWDQNAFSVASSPGGAAVERVALGWLLEVLDLPRDGAGAFVTGATMANFTALGAARRSVLADVGWDADRDGLFGAPEVMVVVSEEAHATLHKALGLLGFGRERVTRIPVDDQGRMRSDALGPIHKPAIVCLQAGNVNTGAFDPASIIDAAHAADAWVHVDGAFGLWARAAPERAHLAAGLERADSWAVDAHKWLNVPYDSGLAFVRDSDALRGAIVSARRVPGSRAGTRSLRLHPRIQPAYESGRDLGRPARTRPVGGGRSRRAVLPSCHALRGRTRGGGSSSTERSRSQPGAGVVRRLRDHRANHRRHPGRGHLLVRWHGCGKAKARCGSACRRGRLPMPMSRRAWRRCCG